jgi:hypothetical protein
MERSGGVDWIKDKREKQYKFWKEVRKHMRHKQDKAGRNGKKE